MENKIFTDGLIVKRKETAPDFVIANLSVKIDDFKSFLDKNNKNGWVNIDLKKSQGGKLYGELNTWQPSKDGMLVNPAPSQDKPSDDLPF